VCVCVHPNRAADGPATEVTFAWANVGSFQQVPERAVTFTRTHVTIWG
jgi:hypothetical protein